MRAGVQGEGPEQVLVRDVGPVPVPGLATGAVARQNNF
jgi:hypothetical protein